MPSSLTPEQRSLRASIAANVLHGQVDSRAHTEPARLAFLEGFLRQVDEASPGLPEAERLRRAEHLLRAHMRRLALRSSQARSRKAASA